MKTLGVTFGNGSFQPLAESFARRFAELNGIEAIAIDPIDAPPIEDPSWIKPWLWDLVPSDVERIIWFDGDCVPVAPIMDLFPSYDYPFGGVLDVPDSTSEALRHCPEAKSCQYYFNAGVFFARRVMRPIFDEWKKMLNEGKGQRDQTSLNILLNHHYKPSDIFFLPKVANWMCGFGKAPPNLRMLHLAGWANDFQRIQILRAFMRIFDPVVKGLPRCATPERRTVIGSHL